MDAYITGAFPLKIKHKVQPNTDPALIAAFISVTPMHDCEPYSATITGETCKKRRAQAFHAPRRSFTSNMRGGWKPDIFMSVEKCVTCKSFYKPAPAPVPAKHGLCSCGCGREGRLMARGMLSGCYQRYRKGKVC